VEKFAVATLSSTTMVMAMVICSPSSADTQDVIQGLRLPTACGHVLPLSLPAPGSRSHLLFITAFAVAVSLFGLAHLLFQVAWIRGGEMDARRTEQREGHELAAEAAPDDHEARVRPLKFRGGPALIVRLVIARSATAGLVTLAARGGHGGSAVTSDQVTRPLCSRR
jgi:hypothetical protein